MFKFNMIMDFLITSSKVLAFLIILLGVIFGVYFQSTEVLISSFKYSTIAIAVKTGSSAVVDGIKHLLERKKNA